MRITITLAPEDIGPRAPGDFEWLMHQIGNMIAVATVGKDYNPDMFATSRVTDLVASHKDKTVIGTLTIGMEGQPLAVVSRD